MKENNLYKNFNYMYIVFYFYMGLMLEVSLEDAVKNHRNGPQICLPANYLYFLMGVYYLVQLSSFC